MGRQFCFDIYWPLLPSPQDFQTLLPPLNLVSSSKGHGYGN